MGTQKRRFWTSGAGDMEQRAAGRGAFLLSPAKNQKSLSMTILYRGEERDGRGGHAHVARTPPGRSLSSALLFTGRAPTPG